MRFTFDRLRAAEGHPAPGPACLDELAVAAAADGAATPEAIAHLSRCAACRMQVAHLARLLGDDSVAREVSRLEGRGRYYRPSMRAFAGVAAAAALVVALVPLIPGRDGADDFRDEPQASAAAVPALAQPVTSANGLDSLRWSGVAGATQYRITLFDEEGSLVWTTETVDTVVSFPADTSLAINTPYWWRVEARVDFDRWNASALGTFTLPESR